MFKKNSVLLILISFIDSVVSSAFLIGVLYFLQESNKELLANSLVANLGSIASILVTLFIGALVDRKSKKNMLIFTNITMALVAWIPGLFFHNSYFFVVLLVVNLIVVILNLMRSLSSDSYLKGGIDEQDLKKTISFIQLVAMLGLVLGIFLMSYTVDHLSAKIFFASASIFYLINVIFILFLSKDKITDKEGDQQKDWKEIKVGFQYIKNTDSVKVNVMLANTLTVSQGFIASLIIYYWSRIDPQFEHSSMLVSCLGIGLVTGMVIVNVLKEERKSIVLAFCSLGSLGMLLLFLCKNPLSLAVVLGVIFGSNQVAGVTLKTQRIKVTPIEIQGRIGSVNNMFTAILTLTMAVVISYIGQVIHFNYLPISVLAILNIIFLVVYVTEKSNQKEIGYGIEKIS